MHTPPPRELAFTQGSCGPTRRAPAWAWLVVFAQAGCDTPSTPTERPNVLVITLDTTRADRLGCYGHIAARTPALDAIAAEGVLFERAMSPAPITLPAHVSLFTGELPIEHGVRDNGIFQLVPDATTLAETLSAAGFSTAAFVSARVLSAEYGLAQGFDHYDDQMHYLQGTDQPFTERRAAQTVNAALEWMHSAPPEPWFVWVHFFDPHQPLLPPEPFASDCADLYDAEIAYVDRQISRLLSRYDVDGRLDRTLLVVAADHGESLGEHGELTHGLFVYDATQRVPLLIRSPLFESGRRIDAQVRLTDVFPTVLEVVGEASETSASSASLLPLLRGTDPGAARDAYLETQLPRFTYGISPLAAVSTQTHKLVDAPQPELYAHGTDPRELDNLLAADPETVAQLRAALQELQGGRDPNVARPNRVPSTEERRALEALGYTVPEEGTDAAAAFDPVDPKDYVERMKLSLEAQALLAAGRPAEAARLLEQFVAEYPRDGGAYAHLGRAYAEQQQYDKAIGALIRCVELRPDQVFAAFDLGRMLAQTGRPVDGLAQFDRLLNYSPSFADAYVAAARICRAQNDPESERRYLEAALERSRPRKAQLQEIKARLAELD